MENLFNEWVLNHLGVTVVITSAVTVAIICLTVWCCKVWFKIKRTDKFPCEKHEWELSFLKETVVQKDELPCTVHQQKITEHEKALVRLETSIMFLTKSIDALTQESQKNQSCNSDFTQTNSPLSITKRGYEKVKALGIDAMLANNWPMIKALIDKEVQNKNAYDIDRFCLEQAVVFPEKFLSEKELLILKNDAFKEGLSLTSYMKIVAVLCRDKYFNTIGLSFKNTEQEF